MNPSIELIYGYQHCMGRTQYSAGYADSETAAKGWVREHACKGGLRMRVPAEDPVCWCPVVHCHMKRQRPWFGYRSADGDFQIQPTGQDKTKDGQEQHGPQGA